LEQAIYDAEQKGFLGNNIFGTDYNLRIRVQRGGGA